MSNKKLVKLKKPSRTNYYDIYIMYKDKPCYVYYHYIKYSVDKNLVAIGDIDEPSYWYPAESIDYMYASRLIRCDIKIV